MNEKFWENKILAFSRVSSFLVRQLISVLGTQTHYRSLQENVEDIKHSIYPIIEVWRPEVGQSSAYYLIQSWARGRSKVSTYFYQNNFSLAVLTQMSCLIRMSSNKGSEVRSDFALFFTDRGGLSLMDPKRIICIFDFLTEVSWYHGPVSDQWFITSSLRFVGKNTKII